MPVQLKKPVELYRGDDIRKAVRLKDKNTGEYLDLTGWTGASQLRSTPGSPTVAGTFTIEIADQLTETGRVYLVMPRAQSAVLPLGNLAWDLELTNTADEKMTVLYGTMTVVEDVTRV